jgi:hypothetical protein
MPNRPNKPDWQELARRIVGLARHRLDQLFVRSDAPRFRCLVRKQRAKIEFLGHFLQSLIARPDGDAGL